jgi:hypothetical protein
MATVLVPTILEDIHAASVAVVLEQMGHRPIRWFCGDFPERSAASFSVGHGVSALQFQDYFGSLSLDDVDVFWNRRLGTPIVKFPLCESDKDVATSESESFLRGVLATVSERVFSVNGYYSARVAESKVTQLSAARQLGLRVPETLISNDPALIRAFLAKHDEAGAVFKSFKPVSWEAEDHVAITFTSKIASAALPRDELLRLAPSIFQAYVPKAYEVRVTCMGSEIVAAKLQSQHAEQARVDWRVVSPHELSIVRIALPDDIKQQCFAFLQRFGLVFGCFDFIVTPDGEYVFLEINQMGQFLWIEEANPEIALLQMFCDFLVSRDPRFTYQPKRNAVSFPDVVESASGLVAEDLQVHLRPEKYPNVYRE